jgi:hypothetical protein
MDLEVPHLWRILTELYNFKILFNRLPIAEDSGVE